MNVYVSADYDCVRLHVTLIVDTSLLVHWRCYSTHILRVYVSVGVAYDRVVVSLAAHRPAVDQIAQFLDEKQSWIMPAFFDNKKIRTIAHALAGESHIT